jgi:hypothetical protein
MEAAMLLYGIERERERERERGGGRETETRERESDEYTPGLVVRCESNIAKMRSIHYSLIFQVLF